MVCPEKEPYRPISRTRETRGEVVHLKPENLNPKGSSTCSVRQFMSLIGLHSHRETGLVGSASHEASLVALEKSLACARSFGEDDSSAKVTPSPPGLVAGRGQCIARTTPASPAVYRCEGWGPHLGDCTTKGIWSQPESMLHINFLELKAVFLALQEFEPMCRDQTLLVVTNNTTVVAYINKEGGTRLGCLCALLWRLLSWCSLRQIVLIARHLPGRLNVIADKLSRHRQVIQSGPFYRKCSTTYVCNGTLLRWTCLPPDSTISFPCSCLPFRTRRLGRWIP